MEGIPIKIQSYYEELDFVDTPVSMHRLRGPLWKSLGCFVVGAR